MRRKLKEILSEVFVFLTIFLIGVLIYRIINPYSYLGLENRILFVLVLLGIVLLYLYLEESENRSRLLSFIRVTIGKLHESKFMRLFVEKYRDILLDVTGNLFILGLISLILHHFTSIIVSVWIDISLLTIITFTSGFSWFFIFIQKDEEYYKVKTDPYFKNLFLAGLLVISIGSLKFDFIESNELLSSIVHFIFSIQFYLILATIGFGFFTFYFNRERIEAEAELEQEREASAERKREEEFDRKFTYLAGLNLDYAISENWNKGNYGTLAFRLLIAPLVWIGRLPYSSVRWMYKEGWSYSAGLILIVSTYFFVQFSMFQYPGNYSDEYYHIISAKTLVETGDFPILNIYSEYVRGAPISYIVAFFFSTFGMSLFVAKLVPISLGFTNLVLLERLSKRMVFDVKIRFLLLLTFILSSWLVFNHFYIRHYVFLEFMLLFLAYSISKLKDTISYQKPNGLIYFFIVTFINICDYFLMNDVTKNIIPIATVFGFIYLFLFESHQYKIKQRKLHQLCNLAIKEKMSLLVLLSIVTLLLISNFMDLTSLMNSLLNGTTNTSSSHFNFNSFFFGIYVFFTLFFIIGVIGNIMFKDDNKIIYFIILPLLLLHYISSESNQIMRLMVYMLPLFYLLVFYGLERVTNSVQNKKIIAIILLFFLITTVNILQDDKDRFFSKGYSVFPNEIGYSEYEPMYDYLKNNLSEYTIINTEYNIQKETFFEVETDYKLDFKNVFDNHYTHYYDENSETYRQVYTNTPVIIDRDEYKSIISKGKVCIILSDHANHFLENSDIDEIKNNFREEARFIGFTIYCKE